MGSKKPAVTIIDNAPRSHSTMSYELDFGDTLDTVLVNAHKYYPGSVSKITKHTVVTIGDIIPHDRAGYPLQDGDVIRITHHG